MTAANWEEHPDIVEVRAVVAAVEALVETHQVRTRERSTPCNGLESTILSSVDKAGRIRRLVASAGSGDSSCTTTATYDDAGHLRFVLVQAGAVNGSLHEQRSWLDAQGKLLWQREKTSGPGWTWWSPASSTWTLLRAPEKAIKAGACKLMES